MGALLVVDEIPLQGCVRLYTGTLANKLRVTTSHPPQTTHKHT